MMEAIIHLIPSSARWYDIIEIKGSGTPISFKNNRIYSINEKENSGIGLRVNINGRTGFSYSNNEHKIGNVVKKAVELSNYGEQEGFDLPSNDPADFNPYDPAIELFNPAEEIERGEDAIARINRELPGACVNLGINKSISSVSLSNSKGLASSYRSSSYSASISSSYVMDGGIKVDVWEGISANHPLPFAPLIDKIIEKTKIARTIKKIPGGHVTVIFTPKAFARLAGIVAGGLNARSVFKGISPFAGTIGKEMFNKKFTMTDDPFVPGSTASYPIDDEGVKASKKFLVQNGVIQLFVTDLRYAEKLGIEPGGNGSRGYSSLPSPSFSNIVIPGGPESFQDMIKNIPLGIMVDQFIGLGQSNTITGDFSANLDLAFLIEHGEITGRVKDCMITDNLFTLLAGDMALSAEQEDQGSVITPYVMFPSVSYTG
jgi:PmbA protein